jgi:hypothetical protein
MAYKVISAEITHKTVTVQCHKYSEPHNTTADLMLELFHGYWELIKVVPLPKHTG